MLPIAAAAEKPVVSAWLGEKDAGRGRAAFKAASLPALQNPERGVESFGYLAQYIRNRELRLQVPPPRIDELKFDVQAARRIIDTARSAGRHTLDEQDSKALLASFGIETAMGLFARSAMEARQAAQQLGFPVVLKVRADGITHKSDVGGVILGVQTADEVERGLRGDRAATGRAGTDGALRRRAGAENGGAAAGARADRRSDARSDLRTGGDLWHGRHRGRDLPRLGDGAAAAQCVPGARPDLAHAGVAHARGISVARPRSIWTS